MTVLTFTSEKELRQWYLKKSNELDSFWLQLSKKATGLQPLSSQEAMDVALCFGWSGITIRRIDPFSYKIQFRRRRPKSKWSQLNIKRFKQLKKMGKIHPSGLLAFAKRDLKGSEPKRSNFSSQQLKAFKKNKKAWSFFTQQSPSYQKYMTQWVSGAKREETRNARLRELIHDSTNGTKLLRIVKAQEKTKPKYEPGKTPIEAGMNLGYVTGAELRDVGIDTVEKLQRKGWEETAYRLIELYPHRLNLNMLCSLIGAIEKQNRTNIDPQLKQQAKKFILELKNKSFNW
jgi:uncharacterized protein YdeI (YjbR/CyaY-like superfamily)